MSQINPPPTYAEPVVEDEKTHRATFNPIWLKWFLDIAAYISNNGGSGGTVNHEALAGLLGGASGEHYHFTATEHTALTAGFTGTGNLVRADSPTHTTNVTTPKLTINSASGILATVGTILNLATPADLTTGHNTKDLNINTGNANRLAGNINITSGNSTSSYGGTITIVSGDGSLAGGVINICGGSATASGGIAGNFQMGGGAGTVAGAIGGDAYFLPGPGFTAALDGKLQFMDSQSNPLITLNGPNGQNKLSFFGAAGVATPVVAQQTALGTAAFTNGAGAAVLTGFKSTGGTGASSYTIGDIVLALKNLGLIAV